MDDNNGLDPERTPLRSSILLVITGVIVIAAAIFVAQNSEPIPVQFLMVEGSVPLWLLIVAAMALGAALGWVVSRIRARRRRDEDE
ncbi:MAG: lipopolysaccharide assembly protein LapA domain-containing protein [Acidimicrobiia bacterium]